MDLDAQIKELEEKLAELKSLRKQRKLAFSGENLVNIIVKNWAIKPHVARNIAQGLSRSSISTLKRGGTPRALAGYVKRSSSPSEKAKKTILGAGDKRTWNATDGIEAWLENRLLETVSNGKLDVQSLKLNDYAALIRSRLEMEHGLSDEEILNIVGTNPDIPVWQSEGYTVGSVGGGIFKCMAPREVAYHLSKLKRK